MVAHPAHPVRAAVLALVLAACGATNGPLNDPLPEGRNAAPVPAPAPADEIYIGLAISGGGHRATAFGYGVLDELRASDPGASGGALAAQVRFLSGVSGGAVLATWFAMTGPEGLTGFRERYLLTDGERYMLPDGLDAETLLRGIGLGLNARDTFARALDESLFGGARFSDLRGRAVVDLRIVASDAASAAPFVFDRATFDALCSDLLDLPLSEAVGASAAIPVIFSPFVIEAHRRSCDFAEPPAYAAARGNPAAHPAMRLLAETVARYADPAAIGSVHLLDGGLTDIYGLSGFLSARSEAGLAPMTPAEAVRVRHLLFLAIDGTQENSALSNALLPTGRLITLALYGQGQRLDADGGGDFDSRLAERAITATTTGSADTLDSALALWRQEILDWRCDLAPAELDTLYPDRPADWDCRELHVHAGEIGPNLLAPDLRQRINAVPTRLALSPEDVDLSIAAGRAALRLSPAYAAFLRGIGEDR